MKISTKATAISFMLMLACTAEGRRSIVMLSGNELMPMGRTAVAGTALELISSGAHVGIVFEGEFCTIIASLSPGQHHNYLQYELDGVYQKRVKIKGSAMDTIRIATTSGKHTLWIYKATEAHTGPIFIQQVKARELKALPLPQKPLIEFIGNSITCGAAADASEVPCGSGGYHDQHNAYMAYGPRVARALGANFVLSSVSGIGIYRSWNSERPAMPDVYSKTDFQEQGNRLWNFEHHTPQVVAITLGTNDLSRGDGKQVRQPFNPSTFTARYIAFIHAIKQKYPYATIVLLNSPMIKDDDAQLLAQCLADVKGAVDREHPADTPVEVFSFATMTPHGCTGHPDIDDHQRMAAQLLPFLKQHLQQRR